MTLRDFVEISFLQKWGNSLCVFVFKAWGGFIPTKTTNIWFLSKCTKLDSIQMISYYAAGFDIQTWLEVQSDC